MILNEWQIFLLIIYLAIGVVIAAAGIKLSLNNKELYRHFFGKSGISAFSLLQGVIICVLFWWVVLIKNIVQMVFRKGSYNPKRRGVKRLKKSKHFKQKRR